MQEPPAPPDHEQGRPGLRQHIKRRAILLLRENWIAFACLVAAAGCFIYALVTGPR